MYTHEKITLSVVAESIARPKGYLFVGEYDPKAHVRKNVSQLRYAFTSV